MPNTEDRMTAVEISADVVVITAWVLVKLLHGEDGLGFLEGLQRLDCVDVEDALEDLPLASPLGAVGH